MGSIGGVPIVFANVAHVWWNIPPRDVKALWRALWQSQEAEVQGLRRALLKFEYRTDTAIDEAFIATILEPSRMMHTLESLVHEGLLSRQHASRYEDYLLVHIDAKGEWL